MTVSEQRRQFAVDHIRESGILHRDPPPSMTQLAVLAHVCLAHPEKADVHAEAINGNRKAISEVIGEAFYQEGEATGDWEMQMRGGLLTMEPEEAKQTILEVLQEHFGAGTMGR